MKDQIGATKLIKEVLLENLLKQYSHIHTGPKSLSVSKLGLAQKWSLQGLKSYEFFVESKVETGLLLNKLVD